MMEIFIADTYEELSKQAVDNILLSLDSSKKPLICTASGDSPSGLYKEMVERVKKNEVDVSHWHFVGLDEWAGFNGKDEGSCRYHLNRQLFYPLQICNENICFFDGRATNLEAECRKTDDFIRQLDGIDIAVVGLGMNGHVGMNEPGTLPELHSHVAEIDPLTQQVGQKYFTRQQELSHGLTLGIASLMEAKQVILLVNGLNKAEIVHEVLKGKISEQLSASFLRNHPGFKVYLDKAAASSIP